MPNGPVTAPLLRARYETVSSTRAPDPDVLLIVAFGSAPELRDDPRYLRIALEPCRSTACVEVWRGQGPVRSARKGLVDYAEDGEHCIGRLSIDEASTGSLAAAAETAYRSLLEFSAESPYPYLRRIWNYVSDINEGVGDDERYRQFCLGRARAFADSAARGTVTGYPAASAVGKQSAPRTLDVYWIASRSPGASVENPRQVHAFEYPRQYGPASPSFSRATLGSDRLLLISGTASIVGHASLHAGDIAAQVDETLRNIDVLLQASVKGPAGGHANLTDQSLVRAYLRHSVDADRVEQLMRSRLGPTVPILLLCADICRADLLVEIEVTHQR